MRIRCVKALGLCTTSVAGQFSPISCDPQVIPELKQQVSELQKQKQELEANVQEQRRELAGKYELFKIFCHTLTGKGLKERHVSVT